tara:strand:- start:3420 stop:3773 length:354 start_codon:yes stop_codon:yes gene_type:complete
MSSLCFDLDDTICFPNHEYSDAENKYGKAKPNLPVIKAMQDLYLKGNSIIIYTARRMLTHKGDLNKIENEVGNLTRTWLTYYNVPYDELIFGKPYADVYIDDKGLDLKDLDKWVNSI